MLPEKLKTELPGIMQWMIDGCMDWQERGGFAPLEVVTQATAAYLEAEDAMAAWIEEVGQRDPNAWHEVMSLSEALAIPAGSGRHLQSLMARRAAWRRSEGRRRGLGKKGSARPEHSGPRSGFFTAVRRTRCARSSPHSMSA